MNHTPTPWAVTGSGRGVYVPETRYFIASTDDSDHAEEDAKFIVTAVNNHARMYAALEALLAIIHESQGIVGWHLNGAVAEWGEFEDVAEAEAALATARGEGEAG